MTLADRMMWYRAKANLTQQELADLCGLSKMTICQIEKGNQIPSKITQMKIMLIVGGERTNEFISKQNKDVQSVPSDVQTEICGDVGADTESGSVGDGQ